MKYKKNRKGTMKHVDKRYDKKTGTHNNVRITRSDSLVKELSDKHVKLSCEARIIESSHKRGHDNVLLKNIIFTYEGTEYYIEHCWLQEYDYPAGFYQQCIEGRKYYLEFTFYPYHDAIDRGMYGMKVSYAERY